MVELSLWTLLLLLHIERTGLEQFKATGLVVAYRRRKLRILSTAIAQPL